MTGVAVDLQGSRAAGWAVTTREGVDHTISPPPHDDWLAITSTTRRSGSSSAIHTPPGPDLVVPLLARQHEVGLVGRGRNQKRSSVSSAEARFVSGPSSAPTVKLGDHGGHR